MLHPGVTCDQAIKATREAGSHLKPYGSIVKVRFLLQNKGKTARFTIHPAVKPPVLLNTAR